MPFALCPSCRRHVRARERACPFCAAAMAALGATIAGAVAIACDSKPQIAQPYGVPVPLDQGRDAGPGGGDGGSNDR